MYRSFLPFTLCNLNFGSLSHTLAYANNVEPKIHASPSCVIPNIAHCIDISIEFNFISVTLVKYFFNFHFMLGLMQDAKDRTDMKLSPNKTDD